MSVYSKKYHLFLSAILILSFGSQAEAQLWGGLKNALKKKAEEVITKEIKKSGKGEDEEKKEEKTRKKVKQAAAKKPVARPVVKASNDSRVKTTKFPYQQAFPIPTDALYKQYMAEEKTSTAQFPKCFSILIWAGKTRKLNENIRRYNFFPRGSLWHGRQRGSRSGGTYLMAGFKDENFVPVFGKRFGQWTDQDVKDFKSVAVICRQKYVDEIYKESIGLNYLASKDPIRQHHDAKSKLYKDGKYFLDTDLISYSKYVNGTVQTDSDALRNSDSYDTAMAHQRKIYPEYKAALALIDAQKTEAKSMSVAKENILKLGAMSKNSQFAYLWPDEKKRHKTFLDKQAVVLADQMIGIVIANFNDFPETMEGLKDLKARYSQTFNDLKNLKSRKWNDLKQAFEARAAAIAAGIFEGAISEMDSFTSDLDGFNKLVAYREKIRNNLRSFLNRSSNSGQNFSAIQADFDKAYSARFAEILDQVVYDEIGGLANFTDDMDGLMKMMARNRELRNALERYYNGKWAEFERAYVTAFNEKAEDAVTDFEDKMSQLPASTANLRLIQSAVGDIFTTRPMPANLQAYRKVVTEQVQRVQKEIKKIACYKKLDKLDLDEDDRDTAILGYSGETTLGMFICGMKKRGYKFQEFDSAGLFSSTSTLSILSKRGITLSIDMEEVEAVKGREMLVGVMAKDVTSEKKLTLTEWQDYAGRLAGRQ